MLVQEFLGPLLLNILLLQVAVEVELDTQLVMSQAAAEQEAIGLQYLVNCLVETLKQNHHFL